MSRALVACAIILSASGLFAQRSVESASTVRFDASSNLPMQKIGPDDLVGISVYDAPELTRTVRVAADGRIHLPMLHDRITASGLLPTDLEKAISAELVKEGILVDPVVTVSVVEYRSRPISVVGAVNRPLTFQAEGEVTLLDAIARAGGFSKDAGAEILVGRTQASGDGRPLNLMRRVPRDSLINGADPELNLKLEGGEEIRVPEAGKVFVVGNVKKPGAYPISDGAETSILKVLALSEGLLPYTEKSAYIYRGEGGAAGKSQIRIDIKDIVDRKAPDVVVLPQDIVYIPENSGRRARMDTLSKTAIFGGGIAAALIVALLH